MCLDKQWHGFRNVAAVRDHHDAGLGDPACDHEILHIGRNGNDRVASNAVFHARVEAPSRLKRHAPAGYAFYRQAHGSEPGNRLALAVVRMENFHALGQELSPEFENSIRVGEVVRRQREDRDSFRKGARFEGGTLRTDDPLRVLSSGEASREHQQLDLAATHGKAGIHVSDPPASPRRCHC